jgi:hypothetical protein
MASCPLKMARLGAAAPQRVCDQIGRITKNFADVNELMDRVRQQVTVLEAREARLLDELSRERKVERSLAAQAAQSDQSGQVPRQACEARGTDCPLMTRARDRIVQLDAELQATRASLDQLRARKEGYAGLEGALYAIDSNLSDLATRASVAMDGQRAYPVQPPDEWRGDNAPARQYNAPQYNAPARRYNAPQYNAPVRRYNAPQYNAPARRYNAPQYNAPQYNAPARQYNAPQYNAPARRYNGPRATPASKPDKVHRIGGQFARLPTYPADRVPSGLSDEQRRLADKLLAEKKKAYEKDLTALRRKQNDLQRDYANLAVGSAPPSIRGVLKSTRTPYIKPQPSKQRVTFEDLPADAGPAYSRV